MPLYRTVRPHASLKLLIGLYLNILRVKPRQKLPRTVQRQAPLIVDWIIPQYLNSEDPPTITRDSPMHHCLLIELYLSILTVKPRLQLPGTVQRQAPLIVD